MLQLLLLPLVTCLLGTMLHQPAMATIAASYCDVIGFPVPPCSNTAARDLLFLVDASESMSYDRFYDEMLSYAQALFCAFSPRSTNQAGMIIFKNDVRVVIPLAVYTRDQWYEQVERIRDTKDSDNPECCFCCTPLAEAFDVAKEEFTRAALSDFRIAFVITDGVPSNNNAGSGGNPLWWYYNTKKGYNPALYAAKIVAQRAQVLKSDGSRVFLVGIPNVFGRPPSVEFFSGLGAYKGKSTQYKVTRDNKKWTAVYRRDPNPIVSLPVNKNSFSMDTWNVIDLINGTVGALCEATFLPTRSPTRKPTNKPTRSPTTQPTRSPSTTTPSHRPTRSPTRLPTTQPTESPTSSTPSKAPSHSPTRTPTALPTASPSLSPTHKPTLQPTHLPTLLPSLSPTVSKPTISPSTLQPTMYPTRMDLTQVDVTFLVDRSGSMNNYAALCTSLLAEAAHIPEFNDVKSISPCWEVLMRYVMKQVDLLAEIPAGKLLDRKLGWADDFPQNYTPSAGLRVNLVGFACSGSQTNGQVYEYSRQFYPDGPITSRKQLVDLLVHLMQTVTPKAGTCPAPAIEKAVEYVEETPYEATPFQSVILVTDGIFYDGLAPNKAAQGLESYKVTRFAVGIAIGLVTQKQKQTQATQLTEFVGFDRNMFKNLGSGGWGLLPSVALQIAADIALGYDPQSTIPRGWWCGYRTMAACTSNNNRFGNCKWTGTKNGEYKCMHPKEFTLAPTL